MGEHTFSHGDMIECPECPAVERGKRSVKPFLEVVDSNYSGTSTDIGMCPRCNKAWSISFKIDKISRAPTWDIPSRDFEKEKETIRKEMERATNEIRANFQAEFAKIEREMKK